ncbi:MAG: 30S ribosomal protein S5 [Candidatus Wukongarchaeota archaeon]|nr:30S ribosomal protein S5 [Candidatus Wukongarchaeota archaeon]
MVSKKGDRAFGKRSESFGDVFEEWEPKTKLGRLVKEGQIASLAQIFENNYIIREAEIVEVLTEGELEEEVISVDICQRQTDAGEKSRFKATVAVGNKAGFVGVAEGKHKEVGPAIRKGILIAKLNIAPIRRGCGSWECRCNTLHSVPFNLVGKCGSIKLELIPGPKGLGLVAGEAAKTVLRLAGIEDVWEKTFGRTRTSSNFAKATWNALKASYNIMHPVDWVERKRL